MPEPTIAHVADKLALETTRLLNRSRTEEDLRVGFEKLIAPVLASIGVSHEPIYEHFVQPVASRFRGRPDAVHGQVIIEYEPPKALASKPALAHAKEQLISYITATAPEGGPSRMLGVAFDGQTILFLREPLRHGRLPPKDRFLQEGPYPFGPESARTLLSYLRSLSRLPLTPEALAQTYGRHGPLAALAVSAFHDALDNWATPRVHAFFEEWKRLFGIVYGEQFATQRHIDEAKALSDAYDVPAGADLHQLLFSIHTYFAILMKLLAAELLSFSAFAIDSSYSRDLAHSNREELRASLTDLEDGGPFLRRGISNFLEGDFFRWYLDSLSPRAEEAVREMARALSDFEPVTPTITPEVTQDLLKRLYQYLVPQPVRHRLGEYYTPDWLADLLLDEVGYHGESLKRLLDPACGSGTFLVLAIQRVRARASAEGEPPLETAKRILANIVGFDLNPLAVIAARTNYIYALGDLASLPKALEIPIYLADSVLWPSRAGQMPLSTFTGDSTIVTTSAAQFHVPSVWLDSEGFLLRQATPIVQSAIRQKYSVDEVFGLLRDQGLVFPPHEDAILGFISEIAHLEADDKDGIWATFLKNAFVPSIIGPFDFVVGNPPWIRWGYLSQDYRNATLPLWRQYGLFSLKGHEARLGGGEKDFSMLFVYSAADHYLKKGAKLGFLITQEVFKSKGAGEGFRRFRLGEREPLRVLKALDLATVKPFEGASNKTAAIILTKGKATEYPVPYVHYSRRPGVGSVPTDASLLEARSLLRRRKLSAKPIDSPFGSWQTTDPQVPLLKGLQGQGTYKGRIGARVEPYGVFWFELLDVLSDRELLLRNLPSLGKTDIPQIEIRVEADLLFPAIRGADLHQWSATSHVLIMLTQDPEAREGYPESLMKTRWPRSYAYLTRFKETLSKRAAYRKYYGGTTAPFYSQYNIARYTFAPFKVAWKRMADRMATAVISQINTPFGYRQLVPTDTVSFISTDNESEAHFLCAVLNSTPVGNYISSFSAAGRGFGSPSILSHVNIPRFDPSSKQHSELSELSVALHHSTSDNKDEAVRILSAQLDKLSEDLFSA